MILNIKKFIILISKKVQYDLKEIPKLAQLSSDHYMAYHLPLI